ncbi:MAG: hypothetical protein AABW79_04340 [Nanoarchaeota archaeon]
MNKNDYKFQLGDFGPIVGLDKYRERTDDFIIGLNNKEGWEECRKFLRPTGYRRMGLILYNSLLVDALVFSGLLLSSGLEALAN